MANNKETPTKNINDFFEKHKAENNLIIQKFKENPYTQYVFHSSDFSDFRFLNQIIKAFRILENWKKLLPEYILKGRQDYELFSKAEQELANSFVSSSDDFLVASTIFELNNHLSIPLVSYFHSSRFTQSLSPALIQEQFNAVKDIIDTCNSMKKANKIIEDGILNLSKHSIYPGPGGLNTHLSDDLNDILLNFKEEQDLLSDPKVTISVNNIDQEYQGTKKSKYFDVSKFVFLHLRELISACYEVAAETTIPLLMPLAESFHAIEPESKDESFNKKLKEASARYPEARIHFYENYSKILEIIPEDLCINSVDKLRNRLSKIKKDT